ncbi:MAG TPA: type IV pilus twitching motility protein PilT [Candidatus Sumerlaeota bacterium]|nr:MAG: Twitching mobility protein [candidate division BRC1 bacterium ADurb.Bin183]HOE64401.1 type IV pilus twitching motility protein PilT [Candidatus Sumerlaeota bacterium]HRU54506.1 type IV pilus twitching motility protein PilT [Candidatus Sumerlaeia bacterium]HON51142.1 type IV pilus twitching motility protein PilT [Candidatus Sumerlaeota bacterium]HOR64979.1 type IV pilus twitching motility protein PilT [Candidatus Sumerlaeota bacterium]
MFDITDLLRHTIEKDASDLHIVVGRPPVIRVDGILHNVEGAPSLTASDTHRFIYSVLTDLQKQKFEENKDLDFSLSLSNVARFRVNVHFQRGSVGAAFRSITSKIRNFEELHLPTKVCEKLARRPSGLILITGPTGSGKSTTLAAMVDLINNERECHIITIEDPIEYLHSHKKSLIEQREIHEDTHSFQNSLKYALRQDPDVIMVGEMRDLETIAAALTAAETGHLVLSTLHTNDVSQTIDRIIDVFPPHQQSQIRIQLSSVIEGILSQKLLPTASGRGREISIEILMATEAIRNLIREGKTHQIYAMLEAGGQHGMQTMDRSLLSLVKKGKITRDLALLNAKNPEEMKRHLYG